jgi:hypothetical protein
MVGETLHPEESRLDIYIPTRENSGDAGTILVPVTAQKSGVCRHDTGPCNSTKECRSILFN